MTLGRLFRAVFSRPIVATAATLVAASILAGCGTAGMTDAMGVVAQPRLPAPGSATFQQNQSEQGVQQTGAPTTLDGTATRPGEQTPRVGDAYPNLNMRPVAATAQRTPEENAALLANLRATQGRLSAANVAAARSMPNAGDLRRIGAVHGERALDEIARDSAQ